MQTFRAGVGAVILNNNGEVLGLERRDYPGQWQLPQGGLDVGESPEKALYREIYEETGIQATELHLIVEKPKLLAYELPVQARNKKTGRGQVHYWFLLKFKGAEKDITLGNKKEFINWKWMSITELIANVVDFRRSVYQEIAKHFREHLKT